MVRKRIRTLPDDLTTLGAGGYKFAVDPPTGSAAQVADTVIREFMQEGVYSEDETDAAIAAATSTGDGSATSGVVSGLGVAYSGAGLVFNMSAGTARINGVNVVAAAQSVTLAAADATHPRIDTFYVDDAGLFGKITGTAAANPSQPAVDPTAQLYLGFALVPATATDLTSGFTTETIYDEGVEWTATTSGSGFTVDSLSNPNTGTKCIEGSTVAANAYVKFVDGSPATFDSSGNLLLSIRSKATWHAKRGLSLQWFASGVAKGSAVTLREGAFGFSTANTSTYQALTIAKTLFSVPSGTTANELRITAVGSGGSAIGFYIDPIKSQSVASGSGGGTVTGITQDQADARYLKLTGGTLTGDLIVPAEAYGVGWNGSNETPTKNDVYDKIEAVVAGVPGTYTDEMAQDATGGMVDATLVYVDATPVLKRAPITGHVTIADGSNAAALGSFTKAQLDTAVSDGNVLYVGDDIKPTESIIIACSDETTALTAGTAKVTFRMPYAFTLTAVRASVTTAPTGSVLTVDINEAGSTILSTKLTIDASEKTSTTAATPAVISDSSLADDAEITIDLDGVGSTIAGAGLKVVLIGSRT